MVDSPAFLKLSCAVQNYAWGKVGMESEVARLRSGDPGFTLDPQLPYAEVGGIIAQLCILRRGEYRGNPVHEHASPSPPHTHTHAHTHSPPLPLTPLPLIPLPRGSHCNMRLNHRCNQAS